MLYAYLDKLLMLAVIPDAYSVNGHEEFNKERQSVDLRHC